MQRSANESASRKPRQGTARQPQNGINRDVLRIEKHSYPDPKPGITAPLNSCSNAAATTSVKVLSVSSPSALTMASGVRERCRVVYAMSTASKSMPEECSVARQGLPSRRNDQLRQSGLDRQRRNVAATSTCACTLERSLAASKRRFSGIMSLFAGSCTHCNDSGIVIAAPAQGKKETRHSICSSLQQRLLLHSRFRPAQRKCVVLCASLTARRAADVGSSRGPSGDEKQLRFVQ